MLSISESYHPICKFSWITSRKTKRLNQSSSDLKTNGVPRIVVNWGALKAQTKKIKRISHMKSRIQKMLNFRKEKSPKTSWIGITWVFYIILWYKSQYFSACIHSFITFSSITTWWVTNKQSVSSHSSSLIYWLKKWLKMSWTPLWPKQTCTSA